MKRLTSRNEDCVLVNGHALGCATVGEIVQMADRLADYEDMDSKRLREQEGKMMADFLRFFDDIVKRYPMHLEITYSKVTDWGIRIYRKGCADGGSDVEIVDVQDCDMELCFATAQVQLKNWLCDTEGGY